MKVCCDNDRNTCLSKAPSCSKTMQKCKSCVDCVTKHANISETHICEHICKPHAAAAIEVRVQWLTRGVKNIHMADAMDSRTRACEKISRLHAATAEEKQWMRGTQAKQCKQRDRSEHKSGKNTKENHPHGRCHGTTVAAVAFATSKATCDVPDPLQHQNTLISNCYEMQPR